MSEAHDGDPLSRWLEGGGTAALDYALGEAPDVIAVVDRELTIRYVNWTTAGLTREGVVGLKALELAPPEYKGIARETYLRVLETGCSSHFEIMYQGEEHMMMWDVRVGPIRVDGEVIGLVTINADITDQRREQADRDRFFSLSLDMLLVTGADGRFKRANPSFGEALGYSQEEIVGKPFTKFIHPDDTRPTLNAFEGLLAKKPVLDFENRYQRKDGEYLMLSWRANLDPITGDVYGVARDMTRQRTAELQLRQAQKMEAVGQLAGGIAHDFNNLMLAILANTELALMEDPAPSGAVAERLEDVQAAALRAADLTKQLLSFSRRQPPRPVLVDLNALAQGLMTILRRLIPEHIELELSTGQGLSTVSADPSQMEQVLVNLCVNARDAMEGGGKLGIQTENVAVEEGHASVPEPGQYVLVRVSDTGVGMGPDVRERIFEPFFTTKGNNQGTGLGLSTVYGIVQQHAGFIQVHSEVGRGTRFDIYLPAAEPASEKTSEAVMSLPAPGQETILLAEDEEAVRRVLVKMLGRAGYRVIEAEDGAAAIRRLRQHPEPIDLVLLDVVMPGMGGPETWERMRELRSDLKVLFCSGYADGRYLKHLPAQAAILEKPFTHENLLRRIREALDA